MPLYFAYGANMDTAAMALRCPGSRRVGRGRLARHRFVVMREGYASVVRDPARAVWGVLWDLAPGDIPALDRYEGVAGGLYVKALLPVANGAGVKRALIYLGRSTAPGRPRPGYLEAVAAAAEAARLPPAYVREVGAWLRGPPNRPPLRVPMPGRIERWVPAMAKTVTVTISGRVQGVSYRAWTQDTARGLGLSGSVRNRGDGGVEAVFSGPAAAVERMVASCRTGPSGARVTDVAVTEGGAVPAGRGFSILRD